MRECSQARRRGLDNFTAGPSDSLFLFIQIPALVFLHFRIDEFSDYGTNLDIARQCLGFEIRALFREQLGCHNL